MVEDYIDRNLFSKQIKKRFTKNINYNLGNYKISTIDSVKVYKENNEIGDISNYNFDGRILWFSSEETYDYVEIIYTIDSDFELIPLPLKNACLIIIGDLYNNRQEIIIGRSVFNTNIIERILGPYRKTVSL